MNPNFERNPSLIDENSIFAAKVNDALKIVETILDNTRNPSLASPNQVHTYDDKFTLSEFVTNVALSALVNVLDTLSHDSNSTSCEDDNDASAQQKSITKSKEAFRQLTNLVQSEKKSVTMRFIPKETCTFVKEEEVEKENPHQYISETSETTTSEGGRGGRSKTTHVVSKVVQKVKQFHWKMDIEYDIYLYYGNETSLDSGNSIPIITKAVTSCDIITMTSTAPSSNANHAPVDVSLNWLFQNMHKDTLDAQFSIDREKETCRTPRNNDDTRQAWVFFNNIRTWSHRVNNYLIDRDENFYPYNNKMQSREMSNKLFLSSIANKSIFVPVLPVFESLSDNSNNNKSSLLSREDVNLLLEKQQVTMTESVDYIMSKFASQTFMSSTEAKVVLLTKHAASIIELWGESINHVEDMLCTQLYNAVGKYVSSDDLDEFVRSYNQKLFADTYAPEPFCYAIRRPDHYPDGVISIEEYSGDENGKGSVKHAMTFTRQIETSNGEYPMNIPINSATSVQFKGNMYLHAWMLQRFQQKPSFRLASRARQFSSFLLMIGKLSGPNTFEPEHGIILQNQDEVLIPLIMDEMPSAKEFNDAIESLSPEQQNFAKAFRSMKLSSSVFGICVVQLKPQLEILLGLPEHSLTKEIRLTQDLLSLFIDYQIPSDLLSFDGTNDLASSAKVEVVKGHVKNVQDMINDLKKRDLEEAKLKADMAYEERFYAEDEEVDEGVIDFDDAPVYTTMGPSLVPQIVPSSSESRGGYMPKMMAQRARSLRTESAPKKTIIENSQQSVNDILSSTKSADNINFTDLTMVPKLLDSKFEIFGSDERYGGVMRSTTIKTSDLWSKKYKRNLLSKLDQKSLSFDEKKSERSKAFDLLDALSRSGVVPMSNAELHVIIASSHCFDKSVVNTVVQDNVNPIEKIERSQLLVASIIHNVDVSKLIADASEKDRIAKHSPILIKDTVVAID